MGKKRDGRSFWQPDGTKEVREFVIHEWMGLWQAPPPLETTSAWREEMKSQKQAIFQSHQRPLNGHRYPGKRRKPPRERFSDLSVSRSSWLTAARTGVAHGMSQSITENNAGA